MPISEKKTPAAARGSSFTSSKVKEDNQEARLLQQKIQADSEEHTDGQLALDIYQTPANIVIVAPIAGVKMSDIDVSITEDVLTIKGKRYLEFDIPDEDYFTQECFWGDFSRSIVLPTSVDASRISASFKDAVLKISIPKVEKVKTKIVRIKSE
jgi:HSP20 family protein